MKRIVSVFFTLAAVMALLTLSVHAQCSNATLTGSYHAPGYLLLARHSALLHPASPRLYCLFTSQTVRRRNF